MALWTAVQKQYKHRKERTYCHYNYYRSGDTRTYDLDGTPVFLPAHGDGSRYDWYARHTEDRKVKIEQLEAQVFRKLGQFTARWKLYYN